MKNLLLGFIAISMMSLTTADNLKDKWLSYKSEVAKFSVKLPAAFEEDIKEKEKSTTHKVSSTHEEMYYMVSSTIHKNTLDNDIDGLLETSLNSFSNSLKGEVMSRESIELKGVKGIDSHISLGEDSHVRYQVYMKGNYQYQVVSAGLSSDFNQEESDSFFSSFKILK